MQSDKLKPCPFCGGEARLWPVIMPFDADCDTITIQCAECDAVGATVLVDQDVHDQSDLPALEAEAITAWNTRATPSPSTDTLDVLDRIEATLAAAERIMTASPFWDDNSRHAGKALLDYPRSQIAAERAALNTGGSHD